MALKPETVALIRKIQAAITAHPHRYDQTIVAEKFNECGTAACIAGWAAQLRPDFVSMEFGLGGLACFSHHVTLSNGTRMTIYRAASQALELENEAADRFFESDPSARLEDGEDPCWPEPFASRWDRATTDAERAEIACDRLDAYIAERESV